MGKKRKEKRLVIFIEKMYVLIVLMEENTKKGVQEFNGVKQTWTPYLGCMVRTITGAWRYVSEIVKLNFERNMAKMILASIIAKAWPMQFLGPAANGMNRPALDDFDVNLSGLNSFASFPHNSSLWWIASTGIHIDSPFGISKSPSFMSSNAILGSTVAGG